MHEALDRGLWAGVRQLCVCIYVRHAFGIQLIFLVKIVYAVGKDCYISGSSAHVHAQSQAAGPSSSSTFPIGQKNGRRLQEAYFRDRTAARKRKQRDSEAAALED